jgi:hypothetical protein
MAPGFSTTLLSHDELISEFRDFKLKSLSGEINFELKNSVITDDISEKLDFIIHNFPNDLITGSLALYLLGLLTRRTNDIDIIIPDRNRYPKYLQGDYDDEFSTPNRLGFVLFKYRKNIFSSTKEYEVDFFENKEASFLTFTYKRHLIKIHNPLEIMQHKLDIVMNKRALRLTQRKHNEDLTRIFGKSIWQMALSGEFDI